MMAWNLIACLYLLAATVECIINLQDLGLLSVPDNIPSDTEQINLDNNSLE